MDFTFNRMQCERMTLISQWNNVWTTVHRACGHLFDRHGGPNTNNKITYGDHIDKCRFPRILQTDQCQFHFLFPEEAFEPVQDPIDDCEHFGYRCCCCFGSVVEAAFAATWATLLWPIDMVWSASVVAAVLVSRARCCLHDSKTRSLHLGSDRMISVLRRFALCPGRATTLSEFDPTICSY